MDDDQGQSHDLQLPAGVDRNAEGRSMNSNGDDGRKSFTEEIEVAAKDLIARIDALIKEGNVRLLRIRSEKGDVFLELPLTFGAVTGGVVALAAPWLAVLGAVAGLVARVRIEIVRQEPPDDTDEDPSPPEGASSP